LALSPAIREQRDVAFPQSLADLLAAARADERWRLQRDLHDRVGPTLASSLLQAETALAMLASDPEASGRAVSMVAGQLTLALAELRRIVGSTPSRGWDQEGLVEAIRSRARSWELPVPLGQRPALAVRVVAAPGVVGLPAGVEAAAFAIVSEAVANAARHSGAARCVVRLWRDEVLRVEVSDDGAGIAPGAVAGVGLVSMRERAVELGGGCVVEAAEEGGTVVRVWLPLSDTRCSTPSATAATSSATRQRRQHQAPDSGMVPESPRYRQAASAARHSGV
jgi:signal transduction histidine kinase